MKEDGVVEENGHDWPVENTNALDVSNGDRNTDIDEDR
jgi:hypothetical protein